MRSFSHVRLCFREVLLRRKVQYIIQTLLVNISYWTQSRRTQKSRIACF